MVTPTTPIQQNSANNEYLEQLRPLYEQHLQPHMKQLQPWQSFMDKNKFSRPHSVQEAIQRLSHNLNLYKINYSFILGVLFILAMFTNPFFLFSLLIILVLAYQLLRVQQKGGNLSLFGRTFAQGELWAALAVFSLILLWWSSAGSILFWVISVGGFLVLLHAVCLEKSIESDFASQQV